MVALAGATEDPPVPVTPLLRPYQGFTKLPPRALADARRALDDDELRGRVRDAVIDDATSGIEAVGEAGWLLLDRPAGWEAELDALVAAELSEQAAADEAKRERRATKRLDRTLVDLAKAEEAAQRAGAALAEERTRRSEAERLGAEAAEERDGLITARAEAVRQLKEVERRDADRVTELRQLRARVDELEVELAAAVAAAPVDADQPGSDRDLTEVASGAAEVEVQPDDDAARVPVEAIADEVAQAAVAADQLSAALRRVGALLVGGESSATPVTTRTGRGEPGAPADGGGVGEARPRRSPRPLPGGVFDDSVEAARFLCRLPAAVLLVDGYNVSMAGWGELALPAQRRRLVDALRNLQARTGVEPVVVFDGADVDSGPSGSLPRSVQVRFSPAGVIADDVVVEMVDGHPLDRPVIVASDDGEVQQRARARGANIVGADQLLALMAG